MLDFEYENRTRLVFGRGRHREIGSLIKEGSGQEGKLKVLLHYGGGSIKRSGLYDEVCRSLSECGIPFVELGGVQANPCYETAAEGVNLCRREGVNYILAVGGGSVIDSAKAIAMGVGGSGDFWDFFVKKAAPDHILPLAGILTLPAAGSEQSPDAVLSRDGKKVCAIYPELRPRLSIINPELFYTLPKEQIANGICDMMCHIMERYFSKTEATDYFDGLCESSLRTLMENGRKVMEDSSDYDGWSQVVLAGSFGHCGLMGLGREEDWACHGMEHEISALDDRVAHGAGLAVLYPAWMKYVCQEHPAVFRKFAVNVMGAETTFEGIGRLRSFFTSIGLPSSLRELGLAEKDLEHMAKKATCFVPETGDENPLGKVKALRWQDVLNIYESAF